MTSPSSTEKRHRAASLSPGSGPTPTQGSLDIEWESPFDRLCYLLSAPDLARRHRNRYQVLLTELTTGTGCTEEELLAHGLKVRALLFFAEEHLAREGALANLVGTQKHPYRLASVKPAF
jgi:hypothetical protein